MRQLLNLCATHLPEQICYLFQLLGKLRVKSLNKLTHSMLEQEQAWPLITCKPSQPHNVR